MTSGASRSEGSGPRSRRSSPTAPALLARPTPDGGLVGVRGRTDARWFDHDAADHPMREPGGLPRVPAMAQLASLLASLQDGFELLDGTGTILDVNERFAQIVGRSRDEIVGSRPPFPWWADEGP